MDYFYYKASGNSIEPWEAPMEEPRLVELWRGQTVLVDDSQEWYTSEQSDPFDWDYDAEDQ